MHPMPANNASMTIATSTQINIPEVPDWIARCAWATLNHMPHLQPTQALELAVDMHRAWPALTPEKAVECYFSPVITGYGWSTVELA